MIPALYIHIPFCASICPFCSFAVRPDRLENHTPYFQHVRHEFGEMQHDLGPELTKVRSVYFGGGTPSRLLLDELREWVDWLHRVAGFESQAQWSIEANPEDMSPAYAEGLAELGFNRVSIGVQSFQEAGLRKLKRQHTPEKARRAVGVTLDSGFFDFNLDLMFGYPGQNKEMLLEDLAEMVSWTPSHISVYCLNIEEKTPLHRRGNWQQWQNDHEELISAMYHRIVEYLQENGYQQYEVSNFARKGYQSRQNLLNWNGRDYLGLGMGAHSLVNGWRWGNYRRWVDYRNSLAACRVPRHYHEQLSRIQLRDEQLMLGLRMNKGINLSGFQAAFDLDLEKCWKIRLEELRQAGMAIMDRGRLKLSVKGMLLADSITAELASLLEE